MKRLNLKKIIKGNLRLKNQLISVSLVFFFVLIFTFLGLKLNFLEPATSEAAIVTSSAKQKLTVYNGVGVFVDESNDVMEIGNAGRDIASTGNIYIRPNSTSAGSYFVGSGSTQNMFLNGQLRIGADSASPGDGISVHVDSDNSAIYAEQSGSGYAGYFSGRVKIDGHTWINGYTWIKPKLLISGTDNFISGSHTKDTVYIESDTNTSGTEAGVLHVVNTNPSGRSASFSGKMYAKANTDAGESVFEIIQSGNGEALALKSGSSYTLKSTNTANEYAGYFLGRLRIEGNSSLSLVNINQSGTGEALYINDGQLEIFRSDDPPDFKRAALKIATYENSKAIGLNIEVATDQDGINPPDPPYPSSNNNLGWGEGPIYGLKIATGNPWNGATNRENYGIYVKPGWAGQEGETDGVTYGIYVDADKNDSIQFPFTQEVYAGYFKGDVEVTNNLTVAGGNKVLDRRCFLDSCKGDATHQCNVDCNGVSDYVVVSETDFSTQEVWNAVGICCPN